MERVGPLKLPTKVGPWVVEKELGAGAMGAVYRCHAEDDPARVAAVKIMLGGAASSAKARARFVREAKALSRVDHPRCCRCYGYAEGDEPWLALEFIEGRALDSVLHARRRFSAKEALELGLHMLEGLEAAHGVGVIHRDVKPANMILREDGSLVLVDFGLARRDDESMILTAEGAVMGTPHYMSPEQVLGELASGGTDLYAVGATLFHLVAGTPPFTGRGTHEILRKHLNEAPLLLCDVRPDVPLEFARFVHRLMRKKPAERYPSASSARKALERVKRRMTGERAGPAPSSAAGASSSPRGASSPRAARDGAPAGARAGEPAAPQATPRAAPQAPPQRDAPSARLAPGTPQSAPAAAASPPWPQIAAAGALALVAVGWAWNLVAGLVAGAIAVGLAWRLLTPATPGAARARSLHERTRAARALLSEGRAAEAALAFWELGLWAEAGRAFEASGDLGRAAEAATKVGDHQRALDLYERAKDSPRAVEAALALGDGERAAEHMVRCGRIADAANALCERLAELEGRRKTERLVNRLVDIDEAIARIATQASTHLLDVGRTREAAVLLERIGETERATKLFLRAGDRDAAVQVLLAAGQRERAIEVHERAGDRVAAARLRAAGLREEGKDSEAIRVLRLAGEFVGAASIAADLGEHEQAADLFERAGRLEEAADQLTAIGESARAEQLRRAAGSRESGSSRPAAPDLGSDLATAVSRGEARDPAPDPAAARGAGSRAATPPSSSSSRGASSETRDLSGQTIDRYKLLRFLGRGAFATVYRAEHTLLGRAAAIKVLHPRFAADPTIAERFLQEAQVVARLRHPGVVQVYEFGPFEDTLYLAMEEVRGKDLRSVLNAGADVSPDQAATWGAALLEILQAAHDAGVIHRDVKPENVMLEDDGSLRVLDFGMARVFWDQTLDQDGGVTAFHGTPRYSSPEAARSGSVDARSDQYSAAVLIYELLAGRPPHDGESPMALLNLHVNATPEPLKDAPPALADAVARALSKLPEERFPSCSAFAEALRAA